jgi:hypothetical protein
VVLSLHIPTNTGQHRREKKNEFDIRNTVVNREQLYEILKPYTVHIMSGHTHFHEVWMEGNLIEHNHGTVCGAWWTGDICGDGTPNGYGVYEVEGNKISWFYKSTGKPKTHQMRLYPKGRHKEFPEEVCVNIWNYDKNWKVKWEADGKPMSPPEQRTAFDPLAHQTLLGSDLPKGNSWVEPDLTEHLFFMKPGSGVKQITVIATDSFGNKYSESLTM